MQAQNATPSSDNRGDVSFAPSDDTTTDIGIRKVSNNVMGDQRP